MVHQCFLCNYDVYVMALQKWRVYKKYTGNHVGEIVSKRKAENSKQANVKLLKVNEIIHVKSKCTIQHLL